MLRTNHYPYKTLPQRCRCKPLRFSPAFLAAVRGKNNITFISDDADYEDVPGGSYSFSIEGLKNLKINTPDRITVSVNGAKPLSVFSSFVINFTPKPVFIDLIFDIGEHGGYTILIHAVVEGEGYIFRCASIAELQIWLSEQSNFLKIAK